MFLWWVIVDNPLHYNTFTSLTHIHIYTGVRMLKLLNSKPVPRAGVIFNIFFFFFFFFYENQILLCLETSGIDV